MKKRNKLPFDIKRIPFFYGWMIVFAGTVGMLMSTPGQTIGISVFTDQLINTLHIERTTLTLAYFFGTLGSGLLISYVGKLYDLYGARILGILSSILLGVFLVYLSKINIVIGWVNGLTNNNSAIFPFIGIVLGFFGIRFFGQGVLTMVSRNMMMKWFEKRRGLVNAISGVFIAFGFSVAPKVFNTLIQKSDWSMAWLQMAFLAIVVFPVFAWILFRDNPNDCGTKPDGNLKVKASRSAPKFKPDKQYTKKEAIRTYSFWVFTAALFMNALFITAITFNILSIFSESGYSNEKAVSIFIPSAIISVVLNVLSGYLSDRIRLKFILIANVAGMLFSSLGFAILSSAPIAFYMVILGNGIISGTFNVLISIVWPRFYGTQHLGKISGFALSWGVYGSAMGPYFFSLSLKYLGSYQVAAMFCAVVSVVLLFLSFKADNVNEQSEA